MYVPFQTKSHGPRVQIIFRKRYYDINGISETWLKSHHTNKIEGYKLIKQDRTGRGGGGVAFYVRNDFAKSTKISIINKGSSYNLDHLVIECIMNTVTFVVGIGYMHHKCLPLDDLECVFSSLNDEYKNIIYMGDFNIDLLNPAECRKLRQLTRHFNLSTPQSQPTRIHDNGGSLIDIIFSSLPFHSKDFSQHPGIADHDLVAVNFDIKLIRKPEYITFRSYKKIDCSVLQEDIDNLDSSKIINCIDINTKVQLLSNEITHLMDKHIPFITKRIDPNKPPWMTRKILNNIQLRNMAYKVWKSMPCTDNKEILKHYDKKVNGLLKAERKRFLQSKLDPGLNSKELWRNLKDEGISTGQDNDICNMFEPDQLNSAFVTMIPHNPVSRNISTPSSIPVKSNINDSPNLTLKTSNKFRFSEVNEDQVFKALFSLKSESLGHDGIPLKFLKYCMPALLPSLVHIFNYAISTNIFPDPWKITKVIAIPKHNEPKSPNDMRPISLLSTISKVFEKLLSDQIKFHLKVNHLLSDFQSGFRQSHSTVSLLCNVTDFIRSCFDRKNYAALVLLDFSKAFNSINFDILKDKLKFQFQFSREATNLISSYLTGRSQYVITSNNRSSSLPLTAGVPQGSILGPIVFSLYINDVSKLPLNCRYHLFADDVQIFREIPNSSQMSTYICLINKDLDLIEKWSKKNGLTLNASKSQAIIFGKEINYDIFPPICINNQVIPYFDSIRNLGLIMTTNLSWDNHIDKICQKMYNALRLLKSKRHGTPRKTRTLLVRSLVMSHLLYCDIIFSKLNSSLTNKITRVFNGCLRYIYDLRLYDHISQVRNNIFGLPLLKFLDLRVALFIFKSIYIQDSPRYIKDEFQFSLSQRTNILIIKSHETSYMDDALLVRGASIWNSLPPVTRKAKSVDQFKKRCMEFFMSL